MTFCSCAMSSHLSAARRWPSSISAAGAIEARWCGSSFSPRAQASTWSRRTGTRLKVRWTEGVSSTMRTANLKTSGPFMRMLCRDSATVSLLAGTREPPAST